MVAVSLKKNFFQAEDGIRDVERSRGLGDVYKRQKQNCVSLSTAEAEYIAAGSSCSQLVWMKQLLKEYNVEQDVMTLYCDNMSAINISKNLVQHSRTKHIDIRHHYIRDLVDDKVITLKHVDTEEQIADIFTKALDANQFEKLRGKLGICLLEDL